MEINSRGCRPGVPVHGGLYVQGADFKEVCKKTTAFEGSIIRSCRRLDELLNQLALAAHVSHEP